MPDASVLRVDRGSPSPEELAAVTAVLMARLTIAGPPPPPHRRAAPWRRPERANVFDGPRTWHGGS
ncbi:acyl-CoA carboxylase subunit epsilon [Streptomyces sp. NPDC014894]|uniref:acyl-CoA carboxylase subunit epsilon n=1 Tax=unclassified Streptomyces TaxID=2593676 RepID=UPI0036F4F8F2